MPAFTDKKGRIWELELDLLTCRRVDKSDFIEYYPEKFSIMQMDQKVIQAIITRPALCFAIIWAIVQPQIEGRHKASFPDNPEEAEIEFVSSINSQAKADGIKALFEAIGDFFPELKTGLSVANQRLAGLSERTKKGAEKLGPLLDEMEEAAMEEAIEEIRRRMTQGEKPGEILSHLQQSQDGQLENFSNQESLSETLLSPTIRDY